MIVPITASASDHLSRALVRANSTVKVSLMMAPPCVLDEELETYNAAVEAAKQSLSHYVNRMGSNPPEHTTVGALGLWLMPKDDGTALGIDRKDLPCGDKRQR
jgi:hypothetical protein